MRTAHRVRLLGRRHAVAPVLLVSAMTLIAAVRVAAQPVLGDPSAPTGALGSIRIDVGGGVMLDQGLVLDYPSVRIDAPPYSFDTQVLGARSEMDQEQVLVGATVGLGRVADAFGTIGFGRIDSEGFRADREPIFGGGIRLSPPQEGTVRVGLLVRALFTSANEPGVDAGFSFWDVAPTDPDSMTTVGGSGSGAETVSYQAYEALLGFGVHALRLVRPYGGLLYTIVRGEDEVALSGTGFWMTCPRAGGQCSQGSGPTTVRSDGTFSERHAIGAVGGVTVPVNEQLTLVGEGRFLSQLVGAFAIQFAF